MYNNYKYSITKKEDCNNLISLPTWFYEISRVAFNKK